MHWHILDFLLVNDLDVDLTVTRHISITENDCALTAIAHKSSGRKLFRNRFPGCKDSLEGVTEELHIIDLQGLIFEESTKNRVEPVAQVATTLPVEWALVLDSILKSQHEGTEVIVYLDNLEGAFRTINNFRA